MTTKSSWKQKVNFLFDQLKWWDRESEEVKNLVASIKEYESDDERGYEGYQEATNNQALIRLLELAACPSPIPMRTREEIEKYRDSLTSPHDRAILDWVLGSHGDRGAKAP